MEELGEEAFLAFAPNHMYIKVNNKRVGWYNIELTCGDFPTDAWLMASGYIHTDAIRNGIYMKALSTKETLSTCLIDLAQGYYYKYGYDDCSFILACCELALQHYPDYINALLLQAETYTYLYKSIEIAEVKDEIFSKMTDLYSTIHDLGYRKMPENMYTNWLNSMGTMTTNHRMKSLLFNNDENQY